MKKTMAILCAAALLCGGLTACSHGSSSSSVATPAAEKLSFKLADISMSDSFEDITDISRDPVSGKLLVFGQLAGGSYAGYVTTRTFNEYEEFRFTPQEGETVKYAAMLRSGRKAVLTVLDGTTYVYLYDGNNAQEKVIDCGEVLGEDDYASLIASEFGVIIDQSNMGKRELTAVSVSECKVLGQVKVGGDMLIGVCTDKDGVPTVVYNDSDKTYTAHIDGTELTDKTECGKQSSSAYSICAGCGDYALVANLGTSLVGLRDGSWVELTNNMDSDIEFYGLSSMAMTAEDEFAAVQYGDARSNLVLLTAQDISELKTKELITIASFNQGGGGIGQFDSEIKVFNAESDDYRIEYKNYWNDEKLERDYDRLRLDIISGDGPDIIPFDSSLTVDSFNSGVFCDLYEFIDNEPDLKREDFIPNVRKAFERDGKMVMIAPAFDYQTVTAKAGYTGVRENWSIDDMIAAYNAMPEGMYFFSRYEDTNPRSVFFEETVKDYFFVDYDKAECHFDSPEFIKLLNFFNDNKIGLTWEEYNNFNESVHYEDTSYDVLDGKKFVDFDSGGIYWFGGLFSEIRIQYEDECVFVGFPYDGVKSGSYINIPSCLGIVANSPHKEGAWKFLRYMVSDEYYHDKNAEHYYCFPVIESVFDEKAQMTVDGLLMYPCDDNGKIIDGDMIRQDWTFKRYDMSGNVISEKVLEPFTQEECDHYKELIKNSEVIRYDNAIYQIIHEETMSFFNLECTAEECAQRIQNRASIYLSERYG